MTLLRNKRFLLLLLLMAVLCADFWGGSRYPALNEKLLMGGDTPISGLAFSTLVSIAPDDKLVPRVAYETINWVYTNRQGMTFGILFGALLMTLLRLFESRGTRGRFGNTLIGMALGTPLGVCVNCAAPIAKSLHAVGGRSETMLAAMFSSPTLNIVVLTMLFTFFPLYMALIKVGLTLVVILIGVPLLTRFSGAPGAPADDKTVREVAPPIPASDATPMPNPPSENAGANNDRWRDALPWVAKSAAANLWFIVKTTVPLMLLAGFLGALVITLLPLESLVELLPPAGGKRAALALAAIALIGVFLPVPMSFDVIITAVLWQAGLPVKYTMVLLFTLGIFSVFAFFIVWTALGRRIAISLFLGIAAVGIVAGVIGDEYFERDSARQQALFFTTFGASSQFMQGPRVVRLGGESRVEISEGERARISMGDALGHQIVAADADGIAVDRIAYLAPGVHSQDAADPGKMFSRIEGHLIGIDEPYFYSVLSFVQPAVIFRGVASGDVHNDGWMDLLLASDSGLSLYANRQGKGFALQRIDIPVLKDFHVVNAALVDLNNDGWLDIHFSTYRHGNFVVYNAKGKFTADNLVRLPSPGGVAMAGAVAFGDVDRNGSLDIVIGSWTHPCRGYLPCAELRSNNYLLKNDGGQFRLLQPFAGAPGRQTLSLLLTDLNRDGNPDLIVGSEDLAPDLYFLGNGNATFRKITRNDGIIPHSTSTTMSVSSADVDNDLVQEIYIGQITAFPLKDETKVKDAGPALCGEIMQAAQRAGCEQFMRMRLNMPGQGKNRDALKCLAIDTPQYREDCIAYSMFLWAMQNGEPRFCELFPDAWEAFRYVCRNAYREAVSPYPGDSARRRMTISQKGVGNEEIPDVFQRNVLLSQSASGSFTDRATQMGIGIAGFTWNAKFADVDNDGYVDLFAVNGWLPERKQISHVFYSNQGGKRFVDKTHESGLGSFLAASAYTYVDLDNDGDLDIVVVPVAGPILVYMNNSKKSRIAFELRDAKGNRFGIGSKIVIHYGPDATLHQVRELQASGGFISFDAPVAYFGLGDFKQVERVEVHWSTGEKSVVRGDFSAGARYVIRRHSGSAQGAIDHARNPR